MIFEKNLRNNIFLVFFHEKRNVKGNRITHSFQKFYHKLIGPNNKIKKFENPFNPEDNK